ncbi:hypothetical protein GCG21_13660 [Pseudactinotalea sp. HY160]|uniref:hypothetical protein n=1 Tax=Pseudactinotalea sp. HY160 TaxID=2654490 RepID=UPI00128B6F7F|nr:hypothetical protein [Pseudactinotalea sp. HY160]MPV51033.1 hypothetical protein [Pseudactinotalea sp. HY160]
MSIHSRNRQPAGRPTGGQFAQEARAAAGLSLRDADPDTDGHDVDGFDVDGYREQEDWQFSLLTGPGGDALSPDDFEAHIVDVYEYLDQRSRGSVWRSTFGDNWTSEDARQDAVEEMLARAKRNGHVAGVNTGYARGYLAGLVSRGVQAMREGKDPSDHLKVNSAHMKAFNIYAAQADTLEAELGRPLMWHERDNLAEQVRDEWPDQRHRPSVGFHRPMHAQSTDAEEFNPAASSTASAEELYFDSLAAGGEDTERVFSAPKRGGGGRKYGWNAMCEVRGIPKAANGFLNNRQVAYCKEHVPETNDAVLDALQEWESGGHSERTESLFRPFGAASQSHRAQIADLMRDMPDSASQFYTLALAGATKRNFQ